MPKTNPKNLCGGRDSRRENSARRFQRAQKSRVANDAARLIAQCEAMYARGATIPQIRAFLRQNGYDANITINAEAEGPVGAGGEER